MLEIAVVGHAQQTGVEEGLRSRHDDLAVAIILNLFVGGITHTYRPHAAITRELLGFEFVEFGFPHDRIQRLDLPAAGLVHDVA